MFVYTILAIICLLAHSVQASGSAFVIADKLLRASGDHCQRICDERPDCIFSYCEEDKSPLVFLRNRGGYQLPVGCCEQDVARGSTAGTLQFHFTQELTTTLAEADGGDSRSVSLEQSRGSSAGTGRSPSNGRTTFVKHSLPPAVSMVADKLEWNKYIASSKHKVELSLLDAQSSTMDACQKAAVAVDEAAVAHERDAVAQGIFLKKRLLGLKSESESQAIRGTTLADGNQRL
ncbi:hypothetical protein FOZ60_003628 [Perkinsus olseni]|uniref:Uncharacterized protein n=1 Tax=Perkinsus olseni TaxID=32597 RepID=A0A7J6NUW9_PEROL|nr:hypothetical protein FOZ60_003628 [Perkinsus olseni]